MRRKFGRYTVDIKKGVVIKRSDGLLESRSVITGDIEIGIQIEPMTWREDWLAEQVFGKTNAANYKLMNVENRWIGGSDTQNEVVAVWYERR